MRGGASATPEGPSSRRAGRSLLGPLPERRPRFCLLEARVGGTGYPTGSPGFRGREEGGDAREDGPVGTQDRQTGSGVRAHFGCRRAGMRTGQAGGSHLPRWARRGAEQRAAHSSPAPSKGATTIDSPPPSAGRPLEPGPGSQAPTHPAGASLPHPAPRSVRQPSPVVLVTGRCPATSLPSTLPPTGGCPGQRRFPCWPSPTCSPGPWAWGREREARKEVGEIPGVPRRAGVDGARSWNLHKGRARLLRGAGTTIPSMARGCWPASAR